MLFPAFFPLAPAVPHPGTRAVPSSGKNNNITDNLIIGQLGNPVSFTTPPINSREQDGDNILVTRVQFSFARGTPNGPNLILTGQDRLGVLATCRDTVQPFNPTQNIVEVRRDFSNVKIKPTLCTTALGDVKMTIRILICT